MAQESQYSSPILLQDPVIAGEIKDFNVYNRTEAAAGGELFLNFCTPSDVFISVKVLRKETNDISGPDDAAAVVVIDDDTLLSDVYYSFIDTGLVNSTIYFYKVFVLDTDSEYSDGIENNGTPSTVTTPQAVSIDNYESERFSVIVTFSHPDEGGENVDKYEIWWREIGTEGWNKEEIFADAAPRYDIEIFAAKEQELEIYAIDTSNNKGAAAVGSFQCIVDADQLTPIPLGSYWNIDYSLNYRIMYWKTTVSNIFYENEIPFHEFFYEIELNDGTDTWIYSNENPDDDNFIEYQQGTFIRGFSVDVLERLQNQNRQFEWRVRTVYTEEGAMGYYRSSWSEIKDFKLYSRKDLEENERRFEQLADRHIYDKDVLKVPANARGFYNVWNFTNFLAETNERYGNWDLERRGLDNDFNEIRDVPLNDFSSYQLGITKSIDEQWVEFRYKTLKIKDSYINWAGRLNAITAVTLAFTGMTPKIQEIKEVPGWILGDHGVDSHILTSSYEGIIRGTPVNTKDQLSYTINDNKVISKIIYDEDNEIYYEGDDYLIDDAGAENEYLRIDWSPLGLEPAAGKEYFVYYPPGGTYNDCLLWHKYTYGFAVRIIVFDPYRKLTGEKKELYEEIIRKILQKHVKVFFIYSNTVSTGTLIWDQGAWDIDVWG